MKKLTKVEQLQNRFEAQDGYNIDTKIKTVMTGLSFTPEDLERGVDRRNSQVDRRLWLALGQMLLSNLYWLLDEPASHLDMTTVSWLEQYLNSFAGAVVIISHDHSLFGSYCG